MVFDYLGKVERLTKEAAEAKESLDNRYKEIFGSEKYERLERTLKRVLTPGCFFDSVEQHNEFIKGQDIPTDSPSKLIFAADVNIDLSPDGRILDNRAKIGSGFYVSEESFKHSGYSRVTDKILATYVHEFNHLIPTILQRPPLYLAQMFLSRDKGPIIDRSDFIDLAQRLDDSNLLKDEKIKQMVLASSAFALNNIWETSTRVLDKMIMEAIGIDVHLAWRGKQRQYRMVALTGGPGFAFPIAGDPYLNLDDKQVIERTIDWTNHFHPTMNIPYVNNLYESLKGLQVQIFSLDELFRQLRSPKAQKRQMKRERELRQRRRKRK